MCSFSTFCDVFFFFFFYCNVVSSDTPVAAGELFCAFLFTILARNEKTLSGDLRHFCGFTQSNGKDTGSGVSCRQSSACDCT